MNEQHKKTKHSIKMAFKKKLQEKADKMGKFLFSERELEDEALDADNSCRIHFYQIKNFSRKFKQIKEDYDIEKLKKDQAMKASDPLKKQRQDLDMTSLAYAPLQGSKKEISN